MKNLPAGPLRLDVVAGAIPSVIRLDNSSIAAEVIRFREESEKAVAVAGRAVIDSPNAAGNAADVLRAINGSLRKLAIAKTARLDDLKNAVDSLASMFSVSEVAYKAAKQELTRKVGVWRTAEELRIIAESNAKKAERAARAEQLAAAQIALGDAEGAQQIIEEAAAVPDEAPKIQAIGVYGSTMGTARRNVGKVVDTRAFVAALATSKCEHMTAILDRIEFPVSLLNKLAAAVQAGEALSPPGFTADVDTKDVAR